MDKVKRSEIVVSLYLHEYKKDNGMQTLKIRVFHNETKKRKYYGTIYEFKKSDFESIIEATNKKSNFFKIKDDLEKELSKYKEIAESISPFSFEKFEMAINGKKSNSNDIISYYNNIVKELKDNNQIGTSDNYRLSLKSFLRFELHKNGKEPKTLTFDTISVQWLKDYEKYMIDELNRSRTTVSIYLRTLRTIFNNAIFDKIITNEIYPFGKRMYQIPAPKGVKKALKGAQLKTLIEAEPKTPDQHKAKSFWFFSYFCNGMNIKDILNLKYKDLSEDTLTFYRAKTKNTQKEHSPIIIYLDKYIFEVIDKYGNKDKNSDSYIFDIINRKENPETQHKKLKNFIRYINQHFKIFVENNGLSESISSCWARHSFATTALRNGANMELISESMGHENLKTTKGYFAGFEIETKKEMAESLRNF